MTLLQSGPDFNQIVRAVETVGFPIVIAVLILLLVVTPMFLLARSIVTSVSNKADGLGAQISGAVTLFAGTLNSMSVRQEVAADRLGDLATMQIDVLRRQGELIATMHESIRMQLSQTSQQMAQQAALTQQVANVKEVVTGPKVTGIRKPISRRRKAT